MSFVFRRPACVDGKGCCCFKCVSGLCPFGYDPFEDCFPYMTTEQRVMFAELIRLRSEVLDILKKKF